MPELPSAPHSYRQNPTVPAFNDSKPLFIFDGVCVLCSGGAAFVMRQDPQARVNFTAARSPLGQALYTHYAIDWNETYLLIANGHAYTATAGYLKLCELLGGPWQLARATAIIPEPWRDAAYALIARHRYRWFGKADHCALLTPEQRARLL
jgi:predicted DCC family thiol-disulfide oxidoreductase YuxK